MKFKRVESHLLHLAGEYRVCSELLKRGIFATVTYGNHKGVDVYAISERRQAIKIEVKTSQKLNFVTGITQKGMLDDFTGAPDFWILFQLRQAIDGTFTERFFVLSHREICGLQRARNDAYGVRYETKHGKLPDFMTGVDNVTVSDVEKHEDQWDKINKRFKKGQSSPTEQS